MAEFTKIEIKIEDIQAALERETPLEGGELARAERLANQVVGAFEREAFGELRNYGFGFGTVTQRLKSDGGDVYLPFREANHVTEVVDDRGLPVEYRWAEWRSQVVQTGLRSHDFVTVTYEWALVPGDDTVDLLADCVARAMLIPKDVRAGANQLTSSAGPFSQTKNFSSWTVGGQALLSPEDKKAAAALRPQGRGHTWVMQS